MSNRQRRDRTDSDTSNKVVGIFHYKKKKEIQIAPEDRILKLSEMPGKESDAKTVISEFKPVVSDVKPVVSDMKPVVSEEPKQNPPRASQWDDDDDFDEDDDFLDDPDPEEDEEEILKREKEELAALKKEKKELRKKKVKDFFGRIRHFSPGDILEMRWDIKDSFTHAVDNLKQLKAFSKDEIEIDEELDLNARIKIEQNKNRIRIATLCIACVLLLSGIGIYYQVRVFHDFKVLDIQERQDDNATEYVTMKGYRLKCNPNGVTCVNKKNEVVWNTTFTMQSLLIDKCGSIMAVAGQRGNEVYLFNEEGLINSFSVEHIITKMKVTKMGDVAVVLEDGQVTWINVYDKWGSLLIRNKTTMPESGYPLDMDISSNGLKMMISFLGVEEDIESRVAFYNFSAVGKDSEGKMVNEKTYLASVIPEVKFMDGNYAIAFRDDGVTIFRGQQIPEECNTINIDQEIISQFSSEKYFGLVTESDEEEREHKFKMTIYRENGSRCGKVYFDFEYTNIVINGEQVILYNNTSMRIYSITGKLQFSGSYNKEILKVVPTESSRKFQILTENSVDIVKIK